VTLCRVAFLTAAAWALVSCSGADERTAESAAPESATAAQQPVAAPATVAAPSAESPTPEDSHKPNSSVGFFRDGTEGAGIDFEHSNGGKGKYYLAEITGSGGALFDADGDGDLDLYLVQSGDLEAIQQPSENRLTDRFYRNELVETGKLQFRDVSKTAGVEGREYGMGAAVGDYDSDGDLDLYVANLGPNRLLRNNGDATFSDEAEAAGADDSRWSSTASFLDFDRDGDLDLFIVNYVGFSMSLKRNCYASSSAPDFCGPDSYEATPDRLLRNNGDGTFSDVTRESQLHLAFGAGLGVSAADWNGDGWIDLYVANDGDPNQLWINREGRGFEDEALLAGVALNQAGQPEAGMGVAAGDVDSDGDEDLFIAHLDGESNTLYVNLGDGLFEDRTIAFGLHAPSLPWTGFGTGFLDFDGDGRLDLFVANGAVRRQESMARAGEDYPLQQRNQLYRNEGTATLTLIPPEEAGEPFSQLEVGRGAAFGDVDNDGDTDIVVNNNNGSARLLLNERDSAQGWIGLRLVEEGRDALQARAEVQVDGLKIWRRVHVDGSFASSSDPRLIVGIGSSDGPIAVRVHWADGTRQDWDDLAAGRYWTLTKGRGEAGSANLR